MLFKKYTFQGILIVICLVENCFSQMDFLEELGQKIKNSEYTDQFKKTIGNFFNNTENEPVVERLKEEQHITTESSLILDLPVYSNTDLTETEEETTITPGVNISENHNVLVLVFISTGIIFISFAFLYMLHYFRFYKSSYVDEVQYVNTNLYTV